MQKAEHGHEPVLVRQVVDLLSPRQGEVVVDCTVGRGGHALALAERIGEGAGGGLLVGMDVDPKNLEYAKARVEAAMPGVRARWFQANFAEVEDVLAAAEVPRADVVLADLGVSTNQIMEGHHGLSFAGEELLDMRLDPRIGKTAADLLAELSERELADLLFDNAQERMSFRIARKIVQTRELEPIRTTGQLARLVRGVVPGRPGQLDPATRTFQALRMAVNDELAALQDLLEVMPEILKSGGRAAVISFHSGEDRLVKQAAKQWAAAGLCKVLTKKPVEPDENEMQRNPRSRSAKLRAVRFVGEIGD